MEEIRLPENVELKTNKDGRKAILEVWPCHYGYGMTLGNSLRRVLLSSLPGAAVTAVKIKGAQHEFSAIPGVREDVLEMILNLKSLRLKVESDEVLRLRLHVKGEREVTAADIEPDGQVEIINKDLHIATLTDSKSDLDMEIFVTCGRGFSPVEEKAKDKGDIGLIAVDSLFSPVKEVGYHVEPVRVGQITNFDKLVMDIETDGTVSPKDALDRSVKILLDHFNLLLSHDSAPMIMDEEEVVTEKAGDKSVEVSADEAEAAVEASDEEKPKKAKKPSKASAKK